MSDVCKAKAKSGKHCKARSLADGLCAFHGDPKRAAELGRKGGLKRRRTFDDNPDSETALSNPRSAADVRDILADVMAQVRAGKMDPKIGSTLGYIGTALMKCIEVADLEKRVENLENPTQVKP